MRRILALLILIAMPRLGWAETITFTGTAYLIGYNDSYNQTMQQAIDNGIAKSSAPFKFRLTNNKNLIKITQPGRCSKKSYGFQCKLHLPSFVYQNETCSNTATYTYYTKTKNMTLLDDILCPTSYFIVSYLAHVKTKITK